MCENQEDMVTERKKKSRKESIHNWDRQQADYCAKLGRAVKNKPENAGPIITRKGGPGGCAGICPLTKEERAAYLKVWRISHKLKNKGGGSMGGETEEKNGRSGKKGEWRGKDHQRASALSPLK